MRDRSRQAQDKLMASLRVYLASQLDVVAAYLFGSRAMGKVRPGSDVRRDGELSKWGPGEVARSRVLEGFEAAVDEVLGSE